MPLIVEEILLIVKVLQLGHFRKRTAVWNSTFWCSFLFPSTADVKSKDNNFHTLHTSSCHLPLMWRRKKTLFIGPKSDNCLSLSLKNSPMLWRLEWCGSGWEWCQLLDDAIITMVETTNTFMRLHDICDKYSWTPLLHNDPRVASLIQKSGARCRWPAIRLDISGHATFWSCVQPFV